MCEKLKTGETMIFLWETQAGSARFEPRIRARLVRQSGSLPMRHVPLPAVLRASASIISEKINKGRVQGAHRPPPLWHASSAIFTYRRLELKDPIWHSLEWQIGSFSSEATIYILKGPCWIKKFNFVNFEKTNCTKLHSLLILNIIRLCLFDFQLKTCKNGTL